jgi:putative acyl-CoA dehydrogenase
VSRPTSAGLLEDASFNQSPDFGDADAPAPTGRWRRSRARRLDLGTLSACGKDWRRGRNARSRPGRQREPAQAAHRRKGNCIDFVDSIPLITR